MTAFSHAMPVSIRSYAMFLAILGTVGFLVGMGANLAYGIKHPEADPYRQRIERPPEMPPTSAASVLPPSEAANAAQLAPTR